MPENKTLSTLFHFFNVKDPRVERTKKHLLHDILGLVFCGVTAGAEDWEDIHDYAVIHKDWFRSFLALPNGIPSHDTLARVFSKLSPKEFQASFLSWMNDVHDAVKEQVIAIDGKTMRHPFDKASKKSAIHMVSAWHLKVV